MRRRAWNGQAPADDEQARELLVAAARRCIATHTLAGTSIASIAREAGVTRKTVYRYFETGEQIVAEAELRAGSGILEGLRAVMDRAETPGEKIVEALVFLHRTIPRDPVLATYFVGAEARLAEAPHLTRLAIDVAATQLREAFGIARASKAEQRKLDEASEHAIRVLASLLEHPGEARRSDAAVRAYLRTWLAPSFERVFGAG